MWQTAERDYGILSKIHVDTCEGEEVFKNFERKIVQVQELFLSAG